MDNQTKQKIIKAIKAGCSIRDISKNSGVPERTLWRRIKHDKDFTMAYQYHLAVVINIFSS